MRPFNADTSTATDPPLFDAAIETATTALGSWPDPNPNHIEEGVDVALLADPLDATRTVVLFDSSDGKSTSNGLPRAGMNTLDIIKPAYNGRTIDEYWQAFSFLLPDNALVPDGPGEWSGLYTTGFGPPYNGPSPTGLALAPEYSGGVYTGDTRIQMGGDPALLTSNHIIPRDHWIYMVVHTRHDYAPEGFTEAWVNKSDGAGWTVMPFEYPNGESIAPLVANNNDAWVTDPTQPACYTGIGAYGEEPRQLYVAHHRVGYTVESINSTANGWVPISLP